MTARRRYVLFGPLGEASRWRTEHPDVRDNQIVYVWADCRSLRGLSSAGTEVVRLKGAWAAPAFDEADMMLKLLESGRR